MAIQEQCEKCSRLKKGAYGVKCSFYGKTPSFNGQDCENYNSVSVVKAEVSKKIVPFQSIQEAYESAQKSQLDYNELFERGLTKEECDAILEIIDGEKKNKEAINNIIIGIFLVVAGIGGTVVTVVAFERLFYIIAVGLPLYGIMKIIVGIIGLSCTKNIKYKKKALLLTGSKSKA